MPAVVTWLRDDLRLDDNPALYRACDTGLPVAVVYIWSPEELSNEAPRGAAAWWLENALADLDSQLRARGSRLVFLAGPTEATLRDFMKACDAREVFWNARHSPTAALLDDVIAQHLSSDGIGVHTFLASLLREPDAVLHDEMPYRVFAPYWKAARRFPAREVCPDPPGEWTAPADMPRGVKLENLGIAADASSSLAKAWVPTRAGRNALLENLAQILPDYAEDRDFPFKSATSRLSPYLRFGQVSPAQVMSRVRAYEPGPGAAAFERELCWREYASHILHHFPSLSSEPMDPSFSRMSWLGDEVRFRAWQHGLTGFPIVDAGMRQLRQTGWMHNRARMIVGSFLVKDLLADWRLGAAWFMESLVDADVACNSLNWQWVAGCGPDAAPYVRVFNPVLQGRKFDPDGFYVRRYVPELAYLPDKWIHSPWTAPKSVLKDAGITLGVEYPMPILDHEDARRRALEAYGEARAAVG